MSTSLAKDKINNW